MVIEDPGHKKDRKQEPNLPADSAAEGAADPESYLQEYPELKKDIKNLSNNLGDKSYSKPAASEIVDQILSDEDIQSVFGDFKVIREIGHSGMATVYDAVQISLKRRVALKVLPYYLNFCSEVVGKLKIEAEPRGWQIHPGIVHIYESGKHQNIHYVVEEFIEEGKSLTEWLKELLPVKEFPRGHFLKVAELFVQVADALHHAHRSGVIHCDVNPSNILLTSDFNPKVTNFGLAIAEEMKHLPFIENLSGTVFYMSPEQVRGRQSALDHRTDIYSLGVTLYECLTLERPFQAAKPAGVLQKIVSNEPDDPARIDNRVPKDLATICLKAMEKEPHRRYQNMTDFSGDLRRYLRGEAILARPAGPAQRFLRVIKRNPVLSAVSSLAFLILLVLFIYVIWSYPVILAERDKAHRAQQEVVKEAQKANTVNQFMVDMFAAPIPGEEGRDVKVAEMLDLAAEKAGETLIDQPEIEAKFRCTLGRSYYGLGLYKEAKEQYEKALSIAEQIYEEDHPNRLMVLGHLATALWALGEPDEAEAIHRKVIGLQEKVVGKEHPDTLRSKTNLATALNDQGKLAEAADLLLEVVEIRKRTQGEDDNDTTNAMNNLAISMMDRGMFAEAEKILRTIKTINRRTLGDEHPDTIGTCVNLTYALTEQNKFEEAEPIARKCLELCQKVMGKDHPKTFITECTLANLLMAQKKWSEAEEAFRDVMVRMRRVLGSKHPNALVPAINLGEILCQQGKDQEAEKHFRETMALAEGSLPEKHPNMVSLRMYFAELLINTGQYQEAEVHILKSLAVMEEILGKDHPETLSVVNDAVQLYERWGKPEKATKFRARLSTPQDLDAESE